MHEHINKCTFIYVLCTRLHRKQLTITCLRVVKNVRRKCNRHSNNEFSISPSVRWTIMFHQSYCVWETRTSFRCPSLLVCAVCCFSGLQKAEHIAHDRIQVQREFLYILHSCEYFEEGRRGRPSSFYLCDLLLSLICDFVLVLWLWWSLSSFFSIILYHRHHYHHQFIYYSNPLSFFFLRVKTTVLSPNHIHF